MFNCDNQFISSLFELKARFHQSSPGLIQGKDQPGRFVHVTGYGLKWSIRETLKDKYLDVYHTSKSKFFHLEDCHVNESENHQDEMKCCGNNNSPFVVYRFGSNYFIPERYGGGLSWSPSEHILRNLASPGSWWIQVLKFLDQRVKFRERTIKDNRITNAVMDSWKGPMLNVETFIFNPVIYMIYNISLNKPL